MSNAIMSAPGVLPPEDEAECVLAMTTRRRSRSRGGEDICEPQLLVKRTRIAVDDDQISVQQIVCEVMEDQTTTTTSSAALPLAFANRSEGLLHPQVDEDEDVGVLMLKDQNKKDSIAGSRVVAPACQQQRVEKVIPGQTRYLATVGAAFASCQQQQLQLVRVGKAVKDEDEGQTRSPLAVIATACRGEAAHQHQHQESFEINRNDTLVGSHDDHDHDHCDSSTEEQRRSNGFVPFGERIEKLLKYKAQFGTFDVPLKYTADDALGQWCSNIRHTHKRLVLGKKIENKNIKDRMNRLESIGFNWETKSDFAEVFEERMKDLQKYKDGFGHCDVPGKYSEDRALGNWCIRMRYSYKLKPKDGRPNPKRLCQEYIDRLEKIGFRWIVTIDYEKSFDDKCRDLLAFKNTNGHCNVPGKYAQNPSLGNWCNRMRYAYKRMSQGEKTKSNLSEVRIHRLEAMGFKWTSKDQF